MFVLQKGVNSHKRSSKSSVVQVPEREWPTVEELRKLNELRGAEVVTKLDTDYGRAEGLCQRLNVDPAHGLPNTAAEMAERRNRYGANTVPRGKSKSFLRLVFDASRVCCPY